MAQNQTQTVIVTYRLNWPKGRLSQKSSIQLFTAKPTTAIISVSCRETPLLPFWISISLKLDKTLHSINSGTTHLRWSNLHCNLTDRVTLISAAKTICNPNFACFLYVFCLKNPNKSVKTYSNNLLKNFREEEKIPRQLHTTEINLHADHIFFCLGERYQEISPCNAGHNDAVMI